MEVEGESGRGEGEERGGEVGDHSTFGDWIEVEGGVERPASRRRRRELCEEGGGRRVVVVGWGGVCCGGGKCDKSYTGCYGVTA